MGWGFIWLMFILKIPIVGLFLICRWAILQTDEPTPPEPARIRPERSPDPHRRLDRTPRGRRPRGPHGGEAVTPAPPRVRPAWHTAARGRPLRDL